MLTPISWGRVRGQMVVSTKRHLYEDTQSPRYAFTECRVRIPSSVLPPLNAQHNPLPRFFSDSENETAAQPPCARCHPASITQRLGATAGSEGQA